MPAGLVSAIVVLAYGLMLVAVARRVDRSGLPRPALSLVYPLSIAVYFTSWSFFGAVGTAAADGWPYLAIYLGPALALLFAPGFFVRLAGQVRERRALSIGDFLAQQHDRSRKVAVLVALIALVASVPYIALQLRAVASTFAVLAGLERSGVAGLITALALAAFAILFGARTVEVARHNRGLVAALALESLVKLAALLALGLYALVLVSGSTPQALAAQAMLAEQFAEGPGAGFFAATLAAGLAILCLPRQFYLGFVEAPSPEAVRDARVPFLLYLGAVSLLALPLAAAGLAILGPAVPPDLYVLALPLETGATALAHIAFLGGFSAATAMIIAETLALATMATNDLLAPLLLQRDLDRRGADLGRRMRRARRAVIVAIIAAAFLYAETLEGSRSLATIGLVAFAGVAQFAPGLVLASAFRVSNGPATAAGLGAGGLAWLFTLFLPSFAGPAVADRLGNATAGLLHPHALFGLSFGDPLAHGLFWSLGLNLLAMGAVFARDRWRVRRALAGGTGPAGIRTLGDLRALAARFVGEAEANAALGPEFGPASGAIVPAAARRAEQLLARVIGTPSARLLIGSALAGGSLDMTEVVRLLDRSGQSVTLSRTLLAATLEAIDQGVSVIDSSLRLVAWNRRYLELFDYPPGMVVIGRPVADLIRFNAERGECGPGEVEAHVARRLWHLSRGLPHAFERQRPSGRWIRTAGAPIPGGGYVMSFTDITVEKQAQAELERQVADRTSDLAAANRALAAAKAAAEAATRDKTRFLAAASHDLQQPLHAARLFAAALERDLAAGRPAEGMQALVSGIAGALASAQQLLRALLDVSRLDAGGIRPQISAVPLGDLMADLEREFLPLATEKGLSLVVRVRPAMVETDRGLLASVLRNLLSNAIRYTPSGRVLLCARPEGRGVRIEVRDSGPGIAEADQKRIFEEFERLPTTGGTAGAGLGLVIVDRIARLLSAPVRLRSAPGRGSTFAITVPLAKARQEAEWQDAGTAPEPGRRPPGGAHILCLDDDAAALDALVALLAREGLVAWPATTAAQALETAAATPPDAAILDLDLGPGPTGLDVAQRLRQRSPAMPIALVTASPDKANGARLRALGVALVSKPADPATLLAALAPADVRAAAE
ncbi:MAG: PAS-domain containing protein [Thermaurantiacus tibetensis]